jgi:hypothetical protein
MMACRTMAAMLLQKLAESGNHPDGSLTRLADFEN